MNGVMILTDKNWSTSQRIWPNATTVHHKSCIHLKYMGLTWWWTWRLKSLGVWHQEATTLNHVYENRVRNCYLRALTTKRGYSSRKVLIPVNRLCTPQLGRHMYIYWPRCFTPHVLIKAQSVSKRLQFNHTHIHEYETRLLFNMKLITEAP